MISGAVIFELSLEEQEESPVGRDPGNDVNGA